MRWILGRPGIVGMRRVVHFFLGYGYFITHQVILPPRPKAMPTTMVSTNPDGVDHDPF